MSFVAYVCIPVRTPVRTETPLVLRIKHVMYVHTCIRTWDAISNNNKITFFFFPPSFSNFLLLHRLEN